MRQRGVSAEVACREHLEGGFRSQFPTTHRELQAIAGHRINEPRSIAGEQ